MSNCRFFGLSRFETVTSYHCAMTLETAVISTNCTFLAVVLAQDKTSLLTMQQGYGTIYMLILTSLASTLLNVVLV